MYLFYGKKKKVLPIIINHLGIYVNTLIPNGPHIDRRKWEIFVNPEG